MASDLDYIDEDVAYLLGLLLAKGTWVASGGEVRISNDFPFRAARMAGRDQFAGYLSSVNAHILPRLRELLGNAVQLRHSTRDVTLLVTLPIKHLVVRDLSLLLDGALPQDSNCVPAAVRTARRFAIEFVRGYADAAGSARPSNRDQRGLHRVFLDIAHDKWKLGCELCGLLQDVLGVPVQGILWGHPALRGGPSHREHQLRVYAHAFLPIGFYLEAKHSLLQELAHENEILGAPDPQPCDGTPRRLTRRPRRASRGLPRELRHRWVRHFTDVCAALGCPRANQVRSTTP